MPPQRKPWPRRFSVWALEIWDTITMNASGVAKKITGMADGSSGTQDACTVIQMETAVLAATQDLVSKANVDAATTAALPANTRVVDVMTADANGAFPTIDGVAAALNQDYLVKDEGGGASHIDNGIYTLTDVGGLGSPWVLTRRADLDGGDDAAGAFTAVEAGTINGDSTFRCVNNVATGVVNTDTLEWKFWGETTDHANLKNVTTDQHHAEAHVLATSGPHTGLLPSEEVEVAVLGTPTYNLLSELINTLFSAGLISGATITDSGSGEIDVAVGTGLIRTSDSEVAALMSLNTPTATNLALTDESLNYIYVDYNAGTPQIAATVTRSDINNNSEFCIGSVYRNGNSLHITLDNRQIIKNLPYWVNHVFEELHGLSRAFGIIISETGTRNIALTAGEMYNGLNESIIGSYDSSGADDFSYWYYDGDAGPAVWVEVTAQSQIDDTQYNDVATGLATLTANRYGVHWVYMDGDGHVQVVYGQGDYTLVNAQAAQPPGTLPGAIDPDIFMLVGKVIIKKSDATFTEVLTPFITPFVPTAAANHGDLAGVTSAQHHAKYLDTEAVAAVEAAGLDLASGKNINLISTLTSNLTFSGLTETAIAGENLAIGDVCRHDQSENKWYKMDADAEATTDGDCAMATATILADASGVFLLQGFIRNDAWNWTIDDTKRKLFVSVTPGGPAEDAPVGSGDQSRIIGYARTADIVYFKPDNSYVEIP